MQQATTTQENEMTTTPAPTTCQWLVEIDAATYHNARYDEIVAAMTDAEIDEYGTPDPWYPDSAADAVMIVECGGPVAPDAPRGLCPAHEAMA